MMSKIKIKLIIKIYLELNEFKWNVTKILIHS